MAVLAVGRLCFDPFNQVLNGTILCHFFRDLPINVKVTGTMVSRMKSPVHPKKAPR